MATNNSSNQQYTNNADGFSLGGGTTVRTISITGANITVTGSGTNTYTYPPATDTLAGLGTAQTFTATQTFTGAVAMNATTLATDTTTGLKIGTSVTQKLGFFNVTPIVQQATYTVTGATPTRTLAVASVTATSVANVVAQLIADLKAYGFNA